MYEDNVHQEDVMQELADSQLSPGYIVASSNEFPHSNTAGDNPPHRKTRNRYEEIVFNEFLCTGEVSTSQKVQPIILSITPNGIVPDIEDFETSDSAETTLAAAVVKARGNNAPPATEVGFGAG